MASAEMTRLLGRLFQGLESRAELNGSSRDALDEALLDVLGQLMSFVATEEEGDLSKAPPRAVATALATGLFAQPHVGITVDDGHFSTSGPILDLQGAKPDKPVVLPVALMTEALGIAEWEADDLREDVDFRAGKVLKRARAMRWLWARFGLPEANPVNLFRVLFPGAPATLTGVDFLARGAHLYAVVEAPPPPPPAALYLGWVARLDELVFHPLSSFQAHYMDKSVLQELGRAIGADPEELLAMLDTGVTVVPRSALAPYLAHDLWRSRGSAPLTGLAEGYHTAFDLFRALAPSEVPVEGWMAVRNGQLAVRQLRRTFDSLALARVDALMKQLYGELLARLLWEEPHGLHRGEVVPRREDLDLYAIIPALREAFQPVLAWASAEETAAHLAERFNVALPEVHILTRQVRQNWERHVETVWLSPPVEGQPRSVATILGLHLAATQSSLRRMMAREPLRGVPHREVLLHFAAAYLSNSPVERMWSIQEGQSEHLGLDPIGRWFWSGWQRLLLSYDPDVQSLDGEDSYQNT